jgi:anti-sigma-K factor RskA
VSAHRPEHLDLCAAWVLGCIDEADRVELEKHLAEGCPTCDAEIARLSEASTLLAAAAPPVAPRPAVREATLRRVRAEMGKAGAEVVPIRKRSRGQWVQWGLAAASVVLAIGAVALWYSRESVRRDLAAANKSVADLERALEEEQSWTRVFSAQDLRAVEFTATPEAIPALRARGVWDPATRRAMLVFELPATPAGRDYQLWGLHPSGPASLGLVHADARGRSVVRLENAGDPATLQAFAVSLEPAGGSPNPNAPSGPVILVGKFGG